MERILAIIPAYNEERSVGRVITELKQHNEGIHVLVIDDGSRDGTAGEAEKAGAQVISLLQNLGIGGAVQTGYLYALEKDYDIAIQVDADGQHRPEELSKILLPLLKHEVDLVIGSRFVAKTGYVSGAARRLGIRILSVFVSMLSGQRIHDVTSGFRATNRKGIELFASDYSTDYPEVDSLVLLKKHGLRIREVPVEMDERTDGASSITPLRSIYYMLKVTLVLFMRSLMKEAVK